MKAINEILIGFLIFFAIDRAIRLFSNVIVEPWARAKTGDDHKVESWKVGTELVMLIVALFLVFKMRRFTNKA